MATSTFNPSYDRAAIMREAWRLVRKANLDRFPLRFILRNALRTAWQKARTEAYYAWDRARRVAPEELAIRVIEAKERLSAADYDEIRRLQKSMRRAAA